MPKHLFTKTLMELLNKGPYKTEWGFGYYTEYLTLTKNGDMLDVSLSLVSWDAYENGENTFNDTVTVDEFIDFLNNRLSEEKTANVNGRPLNMNTVIEDFAQLVKQEAYDRLAEEQKALFMSTLPTLRALKVHPDDIDWSEDNADSLFENAYDYHSTLDMLENQAFSNAEGMPYMKLLETALENTDKETKDLIMKYQGAN